MDIWNNNTEFKKLLERIKPGSNIKVSGLTDSALGSLVSGIFNELKLNTLIVTERENVISKWLNIIESFSSKKPMGFPADYPAHQIEVLKNLNVKEPSIVVGCIKSIQEKILAPVKFRENIITVKAGISTYREITEGLKDGNYRRVDVVGEPGEFAKRGEVIDSWAPGSDKPVRIIFELDKANTIKIFNPVTQRSVEAVDNIEIVPAEYPEDSDSTVLDYMGNNYVVFVLAEETEEHKYMHRFSASAGIIQKVEVVKADFDFSSRTLRYTSTFSEIKNELEGLKETGYNIILSAPYKQELEKLKELVLEETGLEGRGIISSLDEGFIIEDLKLAIICIGDVLPSHRGTVYNPPPQQHPVKEFSDLSQGDYIIHRKFGIGQFEGIEKIKHGEVISDFLKLKYRASGKLYVAVENADHIQKYVGSKWNTTLDSLTGKSWSKTTHKVRESVKELSKKIIEVYRSRARKGISFKPYADMEKEFADYFPYKLTKHQEQAVDEVLNDMESDNAMDRLICGDVGYGKTEVSMRAAFRAVVNGYQIALLAPTTVLARQHFYTFRNRFRDSGVIIEMLSRLVPQSEQKSIIQRINDGRVDIVIGTHRLLSETVKFPSLGLIVIDEEQRFGVEQKEKLRFRFKNVDLLTTTATPIPRTLAMAFGRIKGFSLINTPPPGRIGIKTHTMPYELDTVRNAIRQEVKRGGQCYYVHSRVGTIAGVVKQLEKELKGIKFKYIHGRMRAEKINTIMSEFVDGEFDCLVSTTIIENGLDLPNVNTMIIDYAHKLGLADIYQLRGRIGRSSIKAYCYLMYPAHMELTEGMKERLSALSSFSAMGSGFQLALRDLQLRGSGELLGPQQHGNIMRVGFDYYTSILKEEIAKLKGENYVEPLDVEISLPVSAFIPENYIDSSGLRLAFYRRLSSITDIDELSSVKEEMKDRFGIIPEELDNLFNVIGIKIKASAAKIESVLLANRQLILKLASGEKVGTTVESKNIFHSVKEEIGRISRISTK